MIEVDAIPDELTSVPQWVCWTERERGGKQTKIPVMPGTASFASVQDPETWASFDAAVETAADDDPVAGIGFVFTEDDPFVGVDLDDCRNAETGEADSWAHEIIEQLDSFTEVSPSGTGYHVYVRGELPDGGNRSGDIECYESARFFTVTGDRVPGTPHDINERTAELADLHAEYIAPSTTSVKGDSSMTASVTPSMDDEDLLEKAMQAKNGPKFTRLWNGETGGYDSHSETDMALACLLAFWTQKDASQMDRLFRQSRLYREKWDEPHYSGGKTYGEGTVERAVSVTSDVYEPTEGPKPVSRGSDSAREGTHSRDDARRRGINNACQPENYPSPTELAALDATIEELEQMNENLEAQFEYLYEEFEAEQTKREQLEKRVAELEEVNATHSRPLLNRLFG